MFSHAARSLRSKPQKAVTEPSKNDLKTCLWSVWRHPEQASESEHPKKWLLTPGTPWGICCFRALGPGNGTLIIYRYLSADPWQGVSKACVRVAVPLLDPPPGTKLCRPPPLTFADRATVSGQKARSFIRAVSASLFFRFCHAFWVPFAHSFWSFLVLFSVRLQLNHFLCLWHQFWVLFQLQKLAFR